MLGPVPTAASVEDESGGEEEAGEDDAVESLEPTTAVVEGESGGEETGVTPLVLLEFVVPVAAPAPEESPHPLPPATGCHLGSCPGTQSLIGGEVVSSRLGL